MAHWTETLKAENALLRKLLKRSLDETQDVLSTRFDKNGKSAPSDYTLGYGACISETSLRVCELQTTIIDELVDNGISLDGSQIS